MSGAAVTVPDMDLDKVCLGEHLRFPLAKKISRRKARAFGLRKKESLQRLIKRCSWGPRDEVKVSVCRY